MAKRQREEDEEESNMLVSEDIEGQKRHKPDDEVPTSILDEEEEVSSQELSALLMTLQQELLDPLPNSEDDLQHHSLDSTIAECSPSSNSVTKDEEEEDEKERVIRHLLEASDDELGIPNRVDTVNESFNGGDDLFNPFSVCDGLWELEDEAANYYTLMQSELFM